MHTDLGVTQRTIKAEEIQHTDLREEAQTKTNWQYAVITEYDDAGYLKNNGIIEILFFPKLGRAAIASGGDAWWTDANSLQQAAERWAK